MSKLNGGYPPLISNNSKQIDIIDDSSKKNLKKRFFAPIQKQDINIRKILQQKKQELLIPDIQTNEPIELNIVDDI